MSTRTLSAKERMALRNWAHPQALPPPMSAPNQVGWRAWAVLKLLDERNTLSKRLLVRERNEREAHTVT